jgi:hypothetical protein
VSNVCAVCNQQYLTCTGFCLTVPEYAERFLALQSDPTCVPSCSTPADQLVCGVTDGCGGICRGADLCGLFARRAEFFPALF